MRGQAIISPCQRYRYLLTRTWEEGEGTVLFVLLNPSTADAENDDPTIRRCIGFARRWGFQQLAVVNLFAWRGTDPRQALRSSFDPVGPDNDKHLRAAERTADTVVAAWGAHGAYLNRGLKVVNSILSGPVECLGLTKQGHPRHPLYLRSDTVRQPMGAL